MIGPILKWTGESKFGPEQSYIGDAGLDLYCSETLEIAPHEFCDIPCGIKIELPDQMWAIITGRSSTLRSKGLLIAQGIIDNGWRGDMFTAGWNMRDTPLLIREGDRVAQLIPMQLLTDNIRVMHVSRLNESVRGENGFGSTGQ